MPLDSAWYNSLKRMTINVGKARDVSDWALGAIEGLLPRVLGVMWDNSQLLQGGPNYYEGIPLYTVVGIQEDPAGVYIPGVTLIERVGDAAFWELTGVLLGLWDVTPVVAPNLPTTVEVDTGDGTLWWSPVNGLQFTSFGLTADWLPPMHVFFRTLRVVDSSVSQGHYDYVVSMITADAAKATYTNAQIIQRLDSDLAVEPAQLWAFAWSDSLGAGIANEIVQEVRAQGG